MITCRASRKFVLAAFRSIVRKHFRLQSVECFDFEPIRTAIIWRARQLSIIYCKTLDGKLSIPVISLSHLLKCLGGESLSFWLKFGKIWSSFYFQTNSLSQNLEIISGSAIVFVLFLFPLYVVSDWSWCVLFVLSPPSHLSVPNRDLSLQLVSFEASLVLPHSVLIWSILMDKNLFVLALKLSAKIRSSCEAKLADYFPAEQTLIFRFRCFQYQECYSLHISLKKLHFLSWSCVEIFEWEV